MKSGHALLSLFGSKTPGRAPPPSLLSGLILTAFAFGCGDDASSSGSGGNGEGASGAGGQAQGGGAEGGAGGQAQGGGAEGGGGQAQGGAGGYTGPIALEVRCGDYHTCARLESGIKCWGISSDGALGQPGDSSLGTPSSIPPIDLGGVVVGFNAGDQHNCALLDSGAVRCWGLGEKGRLGYGNTDNVGDDEAPVLAGDVDVAGAVVQVAAGGSHTCALLEKGTVRCWGNGDWGNLGYGTTDDLGDNEAPASAGDVDVGGIVVQIAAGAAHTCALLDTGAVRCWGEAWSGKLGYGNQYAIGDNEAPALAGDVDVGGTVVQIEAGDGHTCALLDTGAVRCWGRGALGRLGYGNTDDIGENEAPVSAGDVDVGGTVVQIAAGSFHTCALLDTGAVRCWGDGTYGRLGYGNEDDVGDDETPASAGDVDVGGTVVQIAAGDSHTCAILDTGAVRCWGHGFAGVLGHGNENNIGDDDTPASAGDVPL